MYMEIQSKNSKYHIQMQLNNFFSLRTVVSTMQACSAK